MSVRTVVQGIGHATPNKILSNADLEKLVDTTDAWIIQRTGISERRISSDDEFSSTFAIAAGQKAIASSGIPPSEIEMVICATVTPDMPFPSTSCIVQEALKIHSAGAFDVSAACAGFIYALSIADGLVRTGQIKTALVIGVDTLTKVVDWTDRSTCVLFGDGAGAVVVRGEKNTDRGVIDTVLLSDGSGGKHIHLQAGGSRFPVGKAHSSQVKPYIFMAGAEVYRFAVKAMGDACCRALDLAGMDSSEIDLFVPHQANLRIIESAAERLKLPDEKVFVNVHKYGNTSGGSIPIALSEAVQEGRLKKGMVVMTVGFGAGLVWGANIIRW